MTVETRPDFRENHCTARFISLGVSVCSSVEFYSFVYFSRPASRWQQRAI